MPPSTILHKPTLPPASLQSAKGYNNNYDSIPYTTPQVAKKPSNSLTTLPINDIGMIYKLPDYNPPSLVTNKKCVKTQQGKECRSYTTPWLYRVNTQFLAVRQRVMPYGRFHNHIMITKDQTKKSFTAESNAPLAFRSVEG